MQQNRLRWLKMPPQFVTLRQPSACGPLRPTWDQCFSARDGRAGVMVFRYLFGGSASRAILPPLACRAGLTRRRESPAAPETYVTFVLDLAPLGSSAGRVFAAKGVSRPVGGRRTGSTGQLAVVALLDGDDAGDLPGSQAGYQATRRFVTVGASAGPSARRTTILATSLQ